MTQFRDIDKKKILIITQTDPAIDMVFNEWIRNGYEAAVMFKDQNIVMRAIRRATIRLDLPFNNIWCGEWIKRLSDYDVLILHSNNLSGFLPTYIEKRYPKLRIIYWYWNKVDKYTVPSKVKNQRTEFWTFNQFDCERYNMKYNIQYYYDVPRESNVKNESDVLFVGHDHGRKEKIKKIEKELCAEGLKCDFMILSSDKDSIPYHEVQKRIYTTNSILEINQSEQNGYTLRTLESLFFEKKLITDNESVIKLPFYRESNMYVLGKEKRKITQFLEMKYDNSVSKYCEEYNIDAWVRYFFEEQDK